MGLNSGETAPGAGSTAVDTDIRISELFKFVKENDVNYEADSRKPVYFSPREVSPVLLNEDVTPKVFYHGTGERFNSFSPAETANAEGSFFFAENREDAEACGRNVMEVYLRGENLADYDNQPSEFYRLKNKRAQVQWLKERGYDGWYADMDSDGWGEISVFSPNHVKSATGNTGVFNSKNNDIRYAIADDLDEDLEAVLNNKFNTRNNEVVVGTTSDFLVNELGAEVLSNTMPARKAYAAMVSADQAKADGRFEERMHYHNLGVEGLIGALRAAENPIAAIAAAADEKGNKRFDRIVLVTDRKVNGNNVVVVNQVNAKGEIKGKRIKVNKTITAFDNASVYMAIKKAAADGRLLYLNKKRSQSISAVGPRGISSGVDLQNAGFKTNIDAFWANVKWQKSEAGEYNSGNQGNTAMRDAFERSFRENEIKYAIDDEPVLTKEDGIPPEQRTWEDVSNRGMHTYGYAHPELRPYYVRAARQIYLEILGSLKGGRSAVKDKEGYYTKSIGNRRSTTAGIAELLDNGGMTYERIAIAAQVIYEDMIPYGDLHS